MPVGTRSVLFLVLLILLMFGGISDGRPVVKSGYSKNHPFHLAKGNTSQNEDGFWNNVYFVITASDSFFGG
ncbi:unnamed protein product [Caenorhabditis sp. 36 PRJEB53466]|nr:unnamed protein product [Caenorhabditis sp. 36 PRJEB53466]